MTEALGLYNKDPERDWSRVTDYLMFCVERALPRSWPPLPLTAEKLTRFLFFIQRHRGLSTGWKSVQNWRRALVRWLAPVQIDPFVAAGQAFEDTVRASFNNYVPQRRTIKVPMTTELFLAIWTLLGDGSALHELERTLYLLYYVGGFRAATFTRSSDKRGWKRLVRIMHVQFFDAANGRRSAFLCLPQTKTTAAWQPVGHVLQGHPSGDRERCAVLRLEDLINARLASGAKRTDPIFINPRNRLPYSRNVFVDHLRDYINVVASRYVLGRRLPRPPGSFVSAISFRRGAITRLSQAGRPPQEIARFAHHADVNSQRDYICETFECPGISAELLYRGV